MENIEETILDRLSDLMDRAKRGGADSADAVYVHGVSLSASQRLGKPEHLERAEGADLGLRVLMGKRQAIVSSSDISDTALDELLERALAMAKVVPEDEFCGIAEADMLAGDTPDLDECDSTEPNAESLGDLAARAEAAALAVEGVSNSEGGDAGWSRSFVALAATNGFARRRVRTGFSLSAAVLAGVGTAMERDYDWGSAVHFEDLPSPEEIGRRAGEQAVRRLNPRKVETAQVPIVYDPRVSQSIPAHLAGAINGASVGRGTTFLKDMMGKAVMAKGLTIVDDPLRKRGLRSKGFDGEGIATQRRNLIEDGVLQTWVLDLRSARQLGLETTGNASRGVSGPPSPSTTNLHLEAGSISPGDLIANIDQGFYVTEMMGRGISMVTGDYSRGATGFWIENGKITDPVSEVTIAGNLKDMFMNMTPADDLEFRFGTNAPTLRIDGMTVAGK
ncbi:MAG: TldD/PmbA family protein [Rhodospirillaceae bacterium]|jgi:PmbA protein|nr:TldD/PmbA family protein [Rhodospirillaceae bacterium]